MSRPYILHEWEQLPYGDGDRRIPERLANRLASLARSSSFSGASGNGVLEHGRKSLRARGVVGILADRECSLEILPKIDYSSDSGATDPSSERKCLIHMLDVACNLKVDIGSAANVGSQRESLLEILIHAFCSKLTDAIRRGIPRRYVEKTDDLRALRGRMDVVPQFTRHAANPSRLACRFEEFSEDHMLNRLMKAVVSRLSTLSRSPDNQQSLRELALVYIDVEELRPLGIRWNDIVLDRTNERWRDLVEMARLFLHAQYQTTASGATRGMALLFEMNALFEAYVGKLVARALVGKDLRVSLQGGRLYCLTSAANGLGVFQTRPDVLIKRSDKVLHIIDAKWKRISNFVDDRKGGVSQADVYQMMAYAQVYQAKRLTLLYPHHRGLGDKDTIHARHHITTTGAVLESASLDITNRAGILDRVRDLVLQSRTMSDSAERGFG